jgi:hypothetical protein
MSAPLSASVERLRDRPTLVLNGAPQAPVIYALSDCPGARFSWEEVPQRNIAEFYQRGVRLFQLDVWLNQMLTPTGIIDVSLAQRQIAGVSAVAPDAAVMLRLHLNPTDAWCETHPDDCVGYADTTPENPARHGLMRPLADDALRPVRASFYSTAWQEWAHAALREFCERLAATPEGDALFGLQLAYGVYGEWHQFGFIHHDPDTGPAAMESFRSWLQTKYATESELAEAWQQPGLTWDTVAAPSSAAREEARLGVLRDPQTQRSVIDYFTWLHEALTPIILEFGKTAKTSWPRPLVTAAFFGYFYGIFGRQGAGAQLAIGPALKSPFLDCWCSPQSYEEEARALGGPGHARGLIGVVRRAGKLWLDEMDHATTNGGCAWNADFETTATDDVALHRRNVLQPFTRGGGHWWYDFGPTGRTPQFERYGNVGSWDTPPLLEDVAAVTQLVHSRLQHDFNRPADVLLVHDPMSFCHTVSHRHAAAQFGRLPTLPADPITPLLVDNLLNGLYQTGICFEEALLDEMSDLDLSPYRLIILATTPAMHRNHRKAIHQRAAQNGRHVALMGYAAWSDGEIAGPDLMAALTGIATRAHTPPELEQRLELDTVTESRTLQHAFTVPAFDVEPSDVIGTWADGTTSAARRTTSDATWWTFALPPTSPEFLRRLALQAGCHAINSHAETTLVGSGLIIPHSITGGHRQLQLPGGPVIEADLPPRSTTVFDGLTGEWLLG